MGKEKREYFILFGMVVVFLDMFWLCLYSICFTKVDLFAISWRAKPTNKQSWPISSWLDNGIVGMFSLFNFYPFPFYLAGYCILFRNTFLKKVLLQKQCILHNQLPHESEEFSNSLLFSKIKKSQKWQQTINQSRISLQLFNIVLTSLAHKRTLGLWAKENGYIFTTS